MKIQMSNAEISTIKGIKVKLSLEFSADHNIDDYAELETISKEMQNAFNDITNPILQAYSNEVAKSLLGLSGHLGENNTTDKI